MESLGVLVLLLVCTLAPGQKLQQYCRFTPQHTLCRTTGIGKACGQNVPVRGVSQQDAAVIVASHNQMRGTVALGQERRGKPGPQPKGANMMEMEWDEELSVVAQRHADQCIFEHDCADCRQVERFATGQNLFISFQSDKDPTIHWPRAMQAWYDEVALFPARDVNSYNFDAATGHYTQMVWSNTQQIGCGFAMFEEGGWYKKLYTCNYGPAGNIIFTPMYQVGEPCSACPQGTSCSLTYPGLCTADKNSKGQVPDQNIAQNNFRGRGKVVQPTTRIPSQRIQKTQPPKITQAPTKSNQELTVRVKQQNTNTKSLPKSENIQNFLMKFGKDSQVIRTNSLESVKAILGSLPNGVTPLVFFRSSMGNLRQLNNLRLTSPRSSKRRTIRSTRTPTRLQQLDTLQDLDSMLLSCQDILQPCPVVALSGNWTHGRDSENSVVRSVMPSGVGGQIVLGQTIPPPVSDAACVTLSHIFQGPEGATLPQIHVGVWPLGQVLLQEEVSEVSSPEDDGWMMTKVSFAPIRNSFMVVLSVEPNPNSETVELALRGFMVADGLCK